MYNNPIESLCNLFVTLAVLFCLYIALYYLWDAHKKRCPKCRSWFSGKVIKDFGFCSGKGYRYNSFTKEYDFFIDPDPKPRNGNVAIYATTLRRCTHCGTEYIAQTKRLVAEDDYRTGRF